MTTIGVQQKQLSAFFPTRHFFVRTLSFGRLLYYFHLVSRCKLLCAWICLYACDWVWGCCFLSDVCVFFFIRYLFQFALLVLVHSFFGLLVRFACLVCLSLFVCVCVCVLQCTLWWRSCTRAIFSHSIYRFISLVILFFIWNVVIVVDLSEMHRNAWNIFVTNGNKCVRRLCVCAWIALTRKPIMHCKLAFTKHCVHFVFNMNNENLCYLPFALEIYTQQSKFVPISWVFFPLICAQSRRKRWKKGSKKCEYIYCTETLLH